jgi:hypothetical protein
VGLETKEMASMHVSIHEDNVACITYQYSADTKDEDLTLDKTGSSGWVS